MATAAAAQIPLDVNLYICQQDGAAFLLLFSFLSPFSFGPFQVYNILKCPPASQETPLMIIPKYSNYLLRLSGLYIRERERDREKSKTQNP